MLCPARTVASNGTEVPNGTADCAHRAQAGALVAVGSTVAAHRPSNPSHACSRLSQLVHAAFPYPHKPYPPPPRARVRACPQADKLSANIDKHEGKIVKQNVAKKKLEVHMNDHPVDNKMRLTQKAAVRKAKKARPYKG